MRQRRAKQLLEALHGGRIGYGQVLILHHEAQFRRFGPEQARQRGEQRGE
jgi:hypothetical protein